MQALTIRWQHSTAVTSGTPLLTKPIAPVCVQAGLCSSSLASGSKVVLATDQRV